MNKAIKGFIYLLLSSMVIYFLGGVIPKIINLLEAGYEKTFLIAFYWLGIASVIGLPQYFTWFTEDEVSLIAPIKSYIAFIVSIMAVAFISLITDKIFNVITLSSTAGMIYAIIFWLASFLT